MIYYFDVDFKGAGNTAEEAWQDAIEHFELDPGNVPPVLAMEDDDAELG